MTYAWFAMMQLKRQFKLLQIRNELTYQSLGRGYGSLSVNSVVHSITPYGIDISMMLQFCGINESELNRQPECK